MCRKFHVRAKGLKSFPQEAAALRLLVFLRLFAYLRGRKRSTRDLVAVDSWPGAMTVSPEDSEREALASSGQTRIPIEECDGSVVAKRLWREVISVASFLLFSALLYLAITSVLHKSPLNPFAKNNSTLDSNTSREVMCYGDTVLSIALFLLLSLAAGFFAQICKLPPLLGMVTCYAFSSPVLGMLLVGIVLRNMETTVSVLYVDNSVGVFLRKFAFLVILLRGGMGLDARTLMRMKGACLRLAFLPCTIEAISVALAAKLLLGLDIVLGFVLGFILAAVSPAVVVPGMLEIRDRGLGVRAGVPTLVTAAASIDDVYAITCFSLALSMAMNPGDHSLWGTVFSIVRAPVEVLFGVVFGVLGGALLWVLPSPNSPQRHFLRTLLLLAMATSFMFGFVAMGAETIGPIAVLVAAFVVPFKWRADLSEEQTKTEEEEALAKMWNFCLQPLLFTLIGFQLDLSLLSSSLLVSGLLVLLIGLLLRLLTAFFAAFGSGLNKKERLYVAFSWLPKATVQAALAPVVLDYVNGDPEMEPLRSAGTTILTISVLSILVTAPVGAFLMRFTASRLLRRDA
uniref:Na_H_Exchanger domain-containing protein n=1 Tax=Steinernema glaseri TaxID=37863 RepID=A0A1I8AI17_9BILA